MLKLSNSEIILLLFPDNLSMLVLLKKGFQDTVDLLGKYC